MEKSNKDINITLALTLEEMYAGVKKKVKIQRRSKCEKCAKKKCTRCKGEGSIVIEKTIEITIPAGIADGMELGKKNMGHLLQEKSRSIFSFLNKKETNGDLRVKIEEIKHPVFSRRDDHLFFPYEISKSVIDQKAIAITIPHLDKSTLKVQIPQHTTNGKILRIKGKGFKSVTDDTHGDLMICVVVK